MVKENKPYNIYRTTRKFLQISVKWNFVISFSMFHRHLRFVFKREYFLFLHCPPSILYQDFSPKTKNQKQKTSLFSVSGNSLLFRVPNSVSDRVQACRIHRRLLSCQSKVLFKILIFFDLSVGFDTAKPAAILEMFYSCGFHNNISSFYFLL